MYNYANRLTEVSFLDEYLILHISECPDICGIYKLVRYVPGEYIFLNKSTQKTLRIENRQTPYFKIYRINEECQKKYPEYFV